MTKCRIILIGVLMFVFIISAFLGGYLYGKSDYDVTLRGRKQISNFYSLIADDALQRGQPHLAVILKTVALVIMLGDEVRFSQLAVEYNRLVIAEHEGREVIPE